MSFFVCAVCAAGVSGPDNGPDGKMLPARSRWKRPPMMVIAFLLFLFVVLFYRIVVAVLWSRGY